MTDAGIAQKTWEEHGKALLDIWSKEGRRYYYAFPLYPQRSVDYSPLNGEEETIQVREPVVFRFEVHRHETDPFSRMVEIYWKRVFIAEYPIAR